MVSALPKYHSANAEIRLWKSNLYPNVIHPPIKVFSWSIQTWGSLVSLQERYRDISGKLGDDLRMGMGRKGRRGGTDQAWLSR